MVILQALIAGLLMYASFAPMALWWCAPIALALLIHLLYQPKLSRRLFSVVVFATAFFGPLLSWTNTYVGNVPWIILTLLQIALLTPLGFLHLQKSKPWLLLLFPSFWILIELVRTRFPFGGFGWGRAAFSQPDAPYALIAQLGGVPLLSFVVALIGVVLYLLAVDRKLKALWLVILIVFPTFLLASAKSDERRDFSFVAVQGGVPQLGLEFNARATAVFENHLRATRVYLAQRTGTPDVILWPENAVDVDPYRTPFVKEQIQVLVDEYSTPLILGAVLEDGEKFRNASMLWMPTTGPSSVYIKQHLTPFGEYIPLRTIAEFISPYAKDVSGFLPGNKTVLHHVEKAFFAPIICFELLDDQVGREMSRRSNALVIQTNSATFGRSPESEQQLQISRIRSIEHRRYAVSISTSGVSALINPRGKVSQRRGIDQSAIIDSSIALISTITPSDKYGQQVELALIFLPGVFVFAFSRRRVR
ncbi:MAG: apolipoprotein N-acyltransferase [Candidatus Nanopelagicaceae bacterium]|nr:apolipoprotein N-acyltransferase [Candidatus Nanopelagicaceae bacterium]